MSGAALLILTADEDLRRSSKATTDAIRAKLDSGGILGQGQTYTFPATVDEEMALCAAQMDILRARLNALKAIVEA